MFNSLFDVVLCYKILKELVCQPCSHLIIHLNFDSKEN